MTVLILATLVAPAQCPHPLHPLVAVRGGGGLDSGGSVAGELHGFGLEAVGGGADLLAPLGEGDGWVLWFRGQVLAQGRGRPTASFLEARLRAAGLDPKARHLETHLQAQPHHRESRGELLALEVGVLERLLGTEGIQGEDPRRLAAPAVGITAQRVADLLEPAMVGGYWNELATHRTYFFQRTLRLPLQPFQALFRRHGRSIGAHLRSSGTPMAAMWHVTAQWHALGAPDLVPLLDQPPDLGPFWAEAGVQELVARALVQQASPGPLLDLLRERMRLLGRRGEPLGLWAEKGLDERWPWTFVLGPLIRVCVRHDLREEALQIFQEAARTRIYAPFRADMLAAFKAGGRESWVRRAEGFPREASVEAPLAAFESWRSRFPAGGMVLLGSLPAIEKAQRELWNGAVYPSTAEGESAAIAHRLGLEKGRPQWCLLGPMEAVLARGESLPSFLSALKEAGARIRQAESATFRAWLERDSECAWALKGLLEVEVHRAEEASTAFLAGRAVLGDSDQVFLDGVWGEAVQLADGLLQRRVWFRSRSAGLGLRSKHGRLVPRLREHAARMRAATEAELTLNPLDAHLWSLWCAQAKGVTPSPSPAPVLDGLNRAPCYPSIWDEGQVLAPGLYDAFWDAGDRRGLLRLARWMWQELDRPREIRSPSLRWDRPLMLALSALALEGQLEEASRRYWQGVDAKVIPEGAAEAVLRRTPKQLEAFRECWERIRVR